MKEKKLPIGVLLTCLFLAGFWFSPVSAAEPVKLVPFYSPPAGGGAYTLAAGMIAVSNRYMTGVKFVHEATTGTMEMVRRMALAETQKKDAFFDHKEEYFAVHTDAKALRKEDARKGIAVPFHPGAEKYLKEIGAIK